MIDFVTALRIVVVLCAVVCSVGNPHSQRRLYTASDKSRSHQGVLMMTPPTALPCYCRFVGIAPGPIETKGAFSRLGGWC